MIILFIYLFKKFVIIIATNFIHCNFLHSFKKDKGNRYHEKQNTCKVFGNGKICKNMIIHIGLGGVYQTLSREK